jgi:phage terminase large subunit
LAEIDVRFPPKVKFLFAPSRYKALRGGRGSAKSWSIARALLVIGASKTIRVLCTREVQKSIQQSVHQLLEDQVAALGLSSFYEVLQHEIRGKNGTEFYFSGLSDQTADTLKSFEGCDIVWCEEAHSITERSWNILTPTIRKEASEIWVSFNPELESDETYRRFVTSRPPDCVSVEMNYTDNPWFPPVLEAERLHAKATMKAEVYAHIWEGKCKPAVEGAIYFDQMAQAESRIGNCPHDGNLKTHAVWDLGFNDSMAIILAQKVSGELRVIHYIEGNQRTLADYSSELRTLRLDDQPINWGHHYLPHDGFAKRHQTGKTDAEVLGGLQWSIQRTPMLDVESGINRAREIFPRVYFNKVRTERLVESLKRYRRQVSQTTNEPGAPLHDQYSHAADAFRYLAVVSDQLSNDEWGGVMRYPRLTTV